MKDRCPRCNEKVDDIAMWGPVKIGDDDPVHVCLTCHKEAGQIDKAYAEACDRAKRIWLGDINFETSTILPKRPSS